MTMVRADEQCGALVAQCVRVIDAKNTQIQLTDLALTKSLAVNADLNAQLNETQSKLSSPLRNPFFMSTLGVVTGLVLSVVILKASK